MLKRTPSTPQVLQGCQAPVQALPAGAMVSTLHRQHSAVVQRHIGRQGQLGQTALDVVKRPTFTWIVSLV